MLVAASSTAAPKSHEARFGAPWRGAARRLATNARRRRIPPSQILIERGWMVSRFADLRSRTRQRAEVARARTRTSGHVVCARYVNAHRASALRRYTLVWWSRGPREGVRDRRSLDGPFRRQVLRAGDLPARLRLKTLQALQRTLQASREASPTNAKTMLAPAEASQAMNSWVCAPP